MKFPRSPDDLKEEVYSSIDKNYHVDSLRYRQPLKILWKVDGDIILEGVLKIFEDVSRGEKSYGEQAFAGKLLYEVNPKANIELKIILERVLKNYNYSVAVLPFYLKEQFGLNELRMALDYFNLTSEDADVISSVKIFNYWLKVNDTLN